MNLIYMSAAAVSMLSMNVILKLSDFLGLIIKTINFAFTVTVGMFFYSGGLDKILEFVLRTCNGMA